MKSASYTARNLDTWCSTLPECMAFTHSMTWRVLADLAPSLPLSSDSPNELTIVFDRKDTGVISVYADGRSVSNGTLPLLASASIPGEIWMNGRNWRKLDTGFRGDIYRFRMYADALQPQDMAPGGKLRLICGSSRDADR